AGGYLYKQHLDQQRFETVPPESPGREASFVIPPGAHFLAVASDLAAQGFVTDVPRFLALARAKGLTAKVRAGEFLLSTNWLPDRILTEITSTPGVMQRFTVREGLTWWQVAGLVEKAGLGSAAQFAEAVHDPALLARWSIPASTAEGYLFPETYMFTKAHEMDEAGLAELMVSEFFSKARGVFGEELPAPEELHRLVTLASIVEKETGDASERFRIAGVYANRLARPMRLQADPTTIYGLGQDFDGNLRRKHLDDDANPYNTYQRDGLPPGPICSPGLESLKASAFPEQHRYLYFVARGDGTSHFSKTLEEHNAAVAKFQRWGRDRKNYTSTKK
ncbi:MAG: endolytic transglycosylase MltG, partial [Desulfovibrionaceae bacterium]